VHVDGDGLVTRARATSRGEDRRGTALVAVLLTLVVLQLVVAALVMAGSRDQDLAAQRVAASRSFYAAEAAVNMGLREVALNSDIDLDGVIGSISSDGNNANDPQLGGSRLRATLTTAGTLSTITAVGLNQEASRRSAASLNQTATGGSWPGVYVEHFAATSPSWIANVDWTAAPIAVGVMPNIDIASTTSAMYSGGRADNFGIRFTGEINIPTAGTWTFALNSDDGSDLWINGVRVILNDGAHSMTVRTGTATLSAGWHPFEARLFDRTGGSGIIMSWTAPGASTASVVPPHALRCNPASMPTLAVNTTMNITGDSTANSAHIDGYNPASAYGGANIITTGLVATNSTSAGAISVIDSARLRAQVRVGVGGNASSVISTSSGGTVTGPNSALATRIAVMTPRSSVVPASSGQYVQDSSTTWNTNRRYTSVQVNGGSTVITVSGHIIFVVDGDFQFNDSARLVIASNSSLTVYMSGAASFTSTTRLNVGGDPTRLIFSLAGSQKDFQLTDESQVVASVFNATGPVRLHGNSTGSDLFGLVYSNALHITETCGLHMPIFSSGATGSTFRVASWGDQP
jgi:Tfp pilus assembly protein PilX